MTKTFTCSIIATEFNKSLIDSMLEIASSELELLGIGLQSIIRVPGAYEIPLIADIELSKPAVGGLVVLGYIEKGETLHGEVMGHSVSNALVNLQLKLKKPIGLGIIGQGATYEQAEVRYENSARAAVRALKHVADLLGIQ